MNAEMTSDSSSQDVEELVEQARAAEERGSHATAFEFFRLVLALEPAKASAAYRAARNLLEVGRVTDAEAFLARVKTEPTERRWLTELLRGQLCMAQFRVNEAERYFRSAWTLNRESTSPAVMLADCLCNQERFDEAKSVLVEALNVQGDLDEVYFNLGFLMRAKGEYLNAKGYLLKALEITPAYTAAQEMLADVESSLRFEQSKDTAPGGKS
jgi:Flp pilus assembly protein TadD